MRHIVRSAAAFSLIAAGSLCSSAVAQSAKHTPARRPRARQQTVADLQREMRQMHDELQGQIDALKGQIATRDAQITDLNQSNAVAQQQAASNALLAAAATRKLEQNGDEIQHLQATVQQQQQQSELAVVNVQRVRDEQAVLRKSIDNPDAIHYKGLTLTPGGFIAAESLWRQRAMNQDVFTGFNLLPYPGNGEAHTSEWVPSARQSRFSVLASGKVPFGTLSGFFEGDFLSAGTTSNNLQTNSYTLRVRQAWIQAKMNHSTFTAGQMWSLLAEDTVAAQPGKEAFPLLFDGNLHVGFTYIRQPGFRFQQELPHGTTLAIALEASQDQFSASNAPSNFFFGAPGSFQGLNNQSANYTNQVAPDVIAKLSFDPGYGHYEIGGIARFYRDRFYPTTGTSANAQNDTELGGGFVASARFPIYQKKVNFGLHLTAGDGTGRYGASLLPDVTVKPNGTLEPLRNAQGLASLEVMPTPKLTLFGYAGTEYVQRTYYRNAAGTLVGYAPPTAVNTGCFVEAVPTANTGYAPGSANCSGATRNIVEGSAGYVYRIYSGPVGRLQYGFAYSYLTRNGWAGVGGAPKAVNNFVYTSLRYYLP